MRLRRTRARPRPRPPRKGTHPVIVVAGEALIDLVPQGTRPRAPLPALLPRRGGGPYNTAVALGRLGSPAAFCSRVSTDAFGEALLDGLRGGGVDTSLVQRGAEPTTLAVADIGAGRSAGYGFYVEGTADRLFTLPPALPAAARALSLGTCSLVLEPGASAYESLLRREAGAGVFTALDPNIRAGLIPDADAYRARFRSWLPRCRPAEAVGGGRAVAGRVRRRAGRWLGGGHRGGEGVAGARGPRRSCSPWRGRADGADAGTAPS